jgi:hypothetical protein
VYQVELDVINKARRDELQQRHADGVSHDAQMAAVSQQLVSLHENVTKLEQELQSKDKELAIKSQEASAAMCGSNIPQDPLASLERDRIVALEQELQDSRTEVLRLNSEVTRLKSRLSVADDECKIMAERLELAAASVSDKDSIQKSVALMGAVLPPEADAATAAIIEALTAEVEAVRREKDELLEALKQQTRQTKRSSLDLEESKRKAEAFQQELEHAQAAGQAELQSMRHDVDLAKKIAREREMAIDDLCAERDNLQSRLEAVQMARQRDHAFDSETRQNEDDESAGLRLKIESMAKDNTQLFEDNQKLFRDNKKIAGEVRDLNTRLKESQEEERRVKEESSLLEETAKQLKREVSTLTSINNDLSAGKKKEAEDELSMSLETLCLKEEVHAIRLELQQLNVVRGHNRTLSDNLAALSHELKTERDSNRSQAEETVEAMQVLAAQNAALDQQVSSLKDDLQVLRAVKKTRGVMQTNNQSIQTDELPPSHPAENRSREAAALPDPVQLTMTLGMSFHETGEEGSAKREAFKRDMADDLAKASGLPAENFNITKLSAGSVIVDLNIMPDPLGIAPAPSAIARDLEKQAADPNSPLMSGKLTSQTKGIQAQSPQPADPLQARALATDPPGWADHVASVTAPEAQPEEQEPREDKSAVFAPGFDPSAVQLKKRAAPGLGAAAPGSAAGGALGGDGEVAKLRAENDKLLGDNKRMFVDCQRFVKELKELHQGNASLLLRLPRVEEQLLARAHSAVARANCLLPSCVPTHAGQWKSAARRQ